MISCSHWGMFKYRPWLFTVPLGYKLPSNWAEEAMKPGGVILLERE